MHVILPISSLGSLLFFASFLFLGSTFSWIGLGMFFKRSWARVGATVVWSSYDLIVTLSSAASAVNSTRFSLALSGGTMTDYRKLLDLTGRKALVLGAASGIGKASAEEIGRAHV